MTKKAAKKPAFDFVISELETSKIWPRVNVKPMFGSHALYIDNRIMVILRKKDNETQRDNGIWVVVPLENQGEVKSVFPALRPIRMFQKEGRTTMPTWLNLPEDHENFESDSFRLIDMLKANDPLIGKNPVEKKLKVKPSLKVAKKAAPKKAVKKVAKKKKK